MKLALYGGVPAVQGVLSPYTSIGEAEISAAVGSMRRGPLSGYLGGERRGGFEVEALESAWSEAFGVKHAIACNSATNGLLLACIAADIRNGDQVIVPSMTMSATAAAPKFLGAKIEFADIELSTFCIDPAEVSRIITPVTRAIIATNLFGHPAQLRKLHLEKTILIEDNAQAPFASEYGELTGTIGHIGVCSLNVHKFFHAGEGGICVTNNDSLAEAMRMARNHGEMAGRQQVGLNLRMTELTAAVASAQLARGRELVNQRIEIAEGILALTKNLPGIWAPVTREDCRHVFYCLPFVMDNHRNQMVDALIAEGVPLQKGYVKPLYHLAAFRDSFGLLPKAERAHAHVALYENCAHTPTSTQIKEIGEAFYKVVSHFYEESHGTWDKMWSKPFDFSQEPS